MTPSEQWILGLFAVYAIPSFLLGVGLTLLCVYWRMLGAFLSLRNTLARTSPVQAEPTNGLSRAI